jgi:hypothetical protein
MNVQRWKIQTGGKEFIPDGEYVEASAYDALLDDVRCPRAAEWKYLDDGVTLMRAALAAIPERYRDGDPNQLHYAIKEWLERPARAALPCFCEVSEVSADCPLHGSPSRPEIPQVQLFAEGRCPNMMHKRYAMLNCTECSP